MRRLAALVVLSLTGCGSSRADPLAGLELETRQDRIGDVEFTIDVPKGAPRSELANRVIHWASKERDRGGFALVDLRVALVRMPDSLDEAVEKGRALHGEIVRREVIEDGFLVSLHDPDKGFIVMVHRRGPAESLECRLFVFGENAPRRTSPPPSAAGMRRLEEICASLTIR